MGKELKHRERPAGKAKLPSLGRKPTRWKTWFLAGAAVFGLSGCMDLLDNCHAVHQSGDCSIKDENRVRCVIDLASIGSNLTDYSADAAIKIDDIVVVLMSIEQGDEKSDPKSTIGILNGSSMFCGLVTTVEGFGEGDVYEIPSLESGENTIYRITMHTIGLGTADVEVERIEG